jgi:exopolysaccharide biosynthesis polyprenyl glycosylphosphotransferase
MLETWQPVREADGRPRGGDHEEYEMNSVELIDEAVSLPRSSVLPATALPQSFERFEVAAGFFERVADMAAVMTAAVLAYATYELLQIGKHLQYSASTVALTALGFTIVFVLMLDHDGAYKRANSLLRIRETERILRVSTQAFGILFPFSFFFLQPFSRWVVVLAVFLVPLLLVIEKQLAFVLIRHLHKCGYGLRNVLIYGAGSTGRSVFSALVRSPKLGLNPVLVVDDDKRLTGREVHDLGYRRERSCRVIAGPLTISMLREREISLVVVGIPSLSRQRLKEVAAEAFASRAGFAFVPQLSYSSESPTECVDIDGVLISSLRQPSGHIVYETAKRVFDVGVALALLVATAPLWAAIAAAIRLDSRGPIFFRQQRVGHRGSRFDMYKFRSMQVATPKYGFHPTGSDDTRVTRAGRWLRRTSLDELPQLINILKGDMSLVGPRPEMPFIVEGYNEQHRQRLNVLPGLTGLWQLSADRAFLIHENIQYDLYYIRHRNFFMDLAILLHTAAFAMKGV